MRSKNSMFNLVAGIVLQIITLIIGIILPRVMLATFGSEINGLVSSIKQFISYLTLVEAGLAGASIYALYNPLAKKEYNEINKILSTTKRFYNKAGIMFSVLACLLALIFPYIVKNSSIDSLTIIVLVIILGINGSLEFFSMGKYRALLTADQKGYIISIVQSIGQVLNCIIIVVLASSGYSIVVVQLFATVSYVIRAILLGGYIKKKYRLVNFNMRGTSYKLNERSDVLIHQIAAMVVFNSPVALITFFCSLIEVSIYSVYNMIFSGISGILNIFSGALMAGIGDIISIGDKENLKKVYTEYECAYYMIITFIYTCTYVLILPFISIYTRGINDANYIDVGLAMAFLCIGVLNNLRMPQCTLINAAGHFKKTRMRAIIEVIINLVVSIVLVNKLGMIGILLGSICSYAYRTIDSIFYTPKYITNLPVRISLMRILRLIILGMVVVTPFHTFIHIQADNFIQWIMWGCIVAIWSGIVVFIGNYVTERSTVQSLINRVFMVLGRKTRLG